MLDLQKHAFTKQINRHWIILLLKSSLNAARQVQTKASKQWACQGTPLAMQRSTGKLDCEIGGGRCFCAPPVALRRSTILFAAWLLIVGASLLTSPRGNCWLNGPKLHVKSVCKVLDCYMLESPGFEGNFGRHCLRYRFFRSL